jgi:hypothetical protein
MDAIASMLPRRTQFSKSRYDTALPADCPWVFIDEGGKKITPYHN